MPRLAWLVLASAGVVGAGIVPGARFHEIDCGHNDCPRQWSAIRQVLRASGVVN